jgi:phage minor structural protein
MATEKALFTTQADFKDSGIGVSAIPFMYYNTDDTTGWTKVGTTGIVPGAKRNAETYDAGFNWKTLPTASALGRHLISVWIKPSANDISASDGVSHVIFTTRGFGQTDQGFQLHLFNGQLVFRVVGSAGGSITMSSTDTGMIGKTLVANTLYHIIIKYDESESPRSEVFVHDGTAWSRWMFNGVSANMQTIAQTRKLTIGDLPTGTAGTKTLKFWGFIDEFMWFNGSQMPTISELQTTYHDYIANANYIDWWTSSGSMQLGKANDGTYTQVMQVWTSPVVDLGLNGFGDYGRVQFTYLQPPGTTINLWTRTSNDGTTWDAWIKVASDGSIASADKRFIQVKVDFSTTLDNVTPVIQEMQILDYPAKLRLTLTSEPLVLYNDKATGLERIGELANAYDIFITEEIINESGGEETIEWKMAIDDPKRKELGTEPVETIARIGDKQFIVKNPVDSRDESGKKITQFTGEALWYELRDFKVITIDKTEIDPTTMIQAILDGSIVPTGWTIGKIDASLKALKRTITGDWKTVLELLLEVCNLFGAELKFDTIDRTISLVEKIGEDNGVRFYYNKNLKTIERSVDSYDLITRLYLYGANDMTVKTVHPDGLDYVENLDWVNALNLRNKIRVDRFKDERYTIPQNLYDDGKKMVDELSKPTISYSMKISDLSILSGHEHESIGIGDTIYAIDTELMNLLIDARIVRRKYNVRQPKDSEVELNQPKKTLADANQRNIDDGLQILAESDPLDTSDVQQMTVFNHLLNSRAEDGNTYWEVTGTGITNEVGGFSGDASWKIDSGYGKTNSLKQSLFGVSHRSAYTVSAYVYNEGTITRGSSQDAFVGIKVTIHYTEPDDKGNTFEEHLLAIPDITQTTTGGA